MGSCQSAQYVNYRESNFKSGLKRGILSRHNGRVINIPSSKQRVDCAVPRNTESLRLLQLYEGSRLLMMARGRVNRETGGHQISHKLIFHPSAGLPSRSIHLPPLPTADSRNVSACQFHAECFEGAESAQERRIGVPRLSRPQIPLTTRRDTPTVTLRSEDSLIVPTGARGNALERQLSALLLCQPVANSFSLLFIITASRGSPFEWNERQRWSLARAKCSRKIHFEAKLPLFLVRCLFDFRVAPIQRRLPDESGAMCLSSAVNAGQKKKEKRKGKVITLAAL